MIEQLKSRSSQNSFLVIAAVAAMHLALTFAVVASHLGCETRPNCPGALSSAFGEIFGFPLGIGSHLMKWFGHEPNDLVRHVPGGIFVLLVMNSILAALIVWSVAAKLVRRRKDMRSPVTMTYEIIEPPFEKNLVDMSKLELKQYFQWFMEVLPGRMDVLERAVRTTVGFENWRADYAPASLYLVGHWFATQVETRSRTDVELKKIKEKQTFPFDVPDEELTHRTFSLAIDIGMYLGQVFLTNHPSLKWVQDTFSKNLLITVSRCLSALVPYRSILLA